MDIHIQSEKTAEFKTGSNRITCGPKVDGYWIATQKPVPLRAPETVFSKASLIAFLTFLTGQRDDDLETWVDKNVTFSSTSQGALPRAPSLAKEDVLL